MKLIRLLTYIYRKLGKADEGTLHATPANKGQEAVRSQPAGTPSPRIKINQKQQAPRLITLYQTNKTRQFTQLDILKLKYHQLLLSTYYLKYTINIM